MRAQKLLNKAGNWTEAWAQARWAFAKRACCGDMGELVQRVWWSRGAAWCARQRLRLRRTRRRWQWHDEDIDRIWVAEGMLGWWHVGVAEWTARDEAFVRWATARRADEASPMSGAVASQLLFLARVRL